MASIPLPDLTSLADCADFATTVSPFIPQLYDLPGKILESLSSTDDLLKLYLATNPLISALAFSLALAPIFVVISEVNKNYSQVDRVWSILPTVYNAHYSIYAHLSGLPTSRVDHIVAFSTVWSTLKLRLTYNYWRKGGYNIGSEDYRWEIVRNNVPGVVFLIFNVLFIALVQSLLLFSVTIPTYIMLLTTRLSPETTAMDQAMSRLIIFLVVVEYFADQQQWDFQNAKKAYQKTAKVPAKFEQDELDRGFVSSGLWKWSRHPNFAAEQAVWVALYQWSCFSADVYANYSALGAVCYLILFQLSTWLTELLTSQKYPEYKEYQKRVGKFLPKLFPGLPGDFSDKKGKPTKAD